jgi:4-hydroxy-tetrahydrodipicolinate reductase
MGRRVGAALDAMDGIAFVTGLVRNFQLDAEGVLAPLTDDAVAAIAACDVLMDFTARERSMELAQLCAEAGKPCFIGTTGLTEDDLAQLRGLASRTAILYSPNLTRGATTLFGVLEILAERLGPGYDAKVLGLHHNKKKETPSGTSAEIARRIQAGRGDDAPPEIATLLAGGTYGVHEILFASANDEIRISHTVTRPEIDRDVLSIALGALARKSSGYYGLGDLLQA